MQKIGLLCGLSWISTKIYYDIINSIICNEAGGLNSAKLIMNNVNNNEFVRLVESKNFTLLEKRLAEEINILENAGVACLGLTCNTLHHYLDNISSDISVPIVHILETINHYVNDIRIDYNIRKIGVIATEYSVNLRIHQRYLLKVNIETIYPNVSQNSYVNKAIFEVCSGRNNYLIKSNLSNIINNLIAEGADAIILGCTELGLAVDSDDYNVPIIDTAKIHANELARFSLNGYVHQLDVFSISEETIIPA